ncbi:RrF2 family transcriptional regulator [Afifella pfennigii]|uniref:RrF2 family transcriptional regulator n=1 Tax=Afifella pfennigii TaxID=209897 RepID=UPI00055897E3|nr:Rrf2 family transcriptional regulator [Afifella pfennigii]
MQLTAFSDYALRILMYLAITGDRLVPTREIAEQQGLSFDHIAKVAQFLARQGYIEASRGRSGGVRLALSPADISIGEVLRRSEAGSAVVECLRNGKVSCKLAGFCGLTPILADATEAFFATLDGRSLADALPSFIPHRAALGLDHLGKVAAH